MWLTSTRDPQLRIGFKEAVLRNLPPAAAGGLFAPTSLAAWPDVEELLGLSWQARSTEILHRWLGAEYARQEIEEIVAEAFDFPVPLVRVDDRTFALELFHGPSLAFKDFGVRFLAAVLQRLRDEQAAVPGTGESATRTVLTATSGDTGAAVAAAFWRRAGFRVAVLYPEGRISPLQERQLACLGGNVLALAVEGDFDDCQRLARACFADPELCKELGLTSANSINIARLLAQVLYYFEAVAQLRALELPGAGLPAAGRPVFAVPSGNFGNLCAGLYAQALGLGAAGFVAATNANCTVPDYLDSGRYLPRPGIATLSNAMDVGDPSNWERILFLYRRDWESLRNALRWGSLADPATVAVLRDLRRRGYQADPHGAVAYGVLQSVRRAGETGIFLATAHPAKFESALARFGLEPTLPDTLVELLYRPLFRERLAADAARLKARLRAA